MKLQFLKCKIKDLENFLGKKVNYDSDNWPLKQPERWLMEYLHILKKDYYQRLKKK